MKKNSNQIDLFSADNKSNQSKNILTAIDIGSDKIVCFIAKIDEITLSLIHISEPTRPY